MKLKKLVLILLLFPFFSLAQWMPVGKANYNWGPFSVYSLSLYTETGSYQQGIRPLMLSFTFDKQIEGKDFAVSLSKEMPSSDEEKTKLWLKELQRIFPDFSPNDQLSYIALEQNGYFVLNDTVLDYEFEPLFSETLIDIWLSPNSRFVELRNSLLNQTPIKQSENSDVKEKNLATPVKEPLSEQEMDPSLPQQNQLEQPEARSS